MEKYILEAYFKMNDAKSGVDRMKKRYKAMVESPLSTLWEGWEIGSATYGGGTYNHGWTGGPLSLLSRYVGGLEYNSEGYTIRPQLADLQWFKVGAGTFNGQVLADLESPKKEGNFCYQCASIKRSDWHSKGFCPFKNQNERQSDLAKR